MASNPGMGNIQVTQASMPGQEQAVLRSDRGGTSKDPLKRKVAREGEREGVKIHL